MAGDDDISEIAPRLAVAVDGLRRVCDPSIFTFETTRDLEPLDGFMRQTRALEAISFGTAIERRGFNLFVLGTPGSGRHTAVGEFLTRIAAGRPSPDDWVYVNDFKAPQRPRAISLPTGLAPSLRDAMSEAVRELAEATPAAFESDEYRRRQRTIDEEFEAKQQKAFEALSEKARARGVAVLHTPLGFALAPVRDGAVVKPEVFNAWSAQERGAALAAIGDLQTDLREFLELIPRLDKERRGKVRALDREFATLVVDQALADARNAFGALPAVVAHLDAVRADMVENAGLFASAGGEGENQQIRRHDAPAFRRYMVNVIVTNGHDGARAPIVREDSPTLPNLVGRVEHLQQMGTLVTDFMLIKPGALHRANGGYLLIDARKILSEPLAWDGLKRALRHGRIEIESVAEHLNLVSTVSLEPEPIPFSAKVVLFGERIVYHLLCQFDPDFADVFKVAVDFDDVVPRDVDAMRDYARLLSAVARREGLSPFDRGGVARVIEHASRVAEDSQRLSVRLGPVVDLVREADYHAKAAGAPAITATHVMRAERARVRRLDLARERGQEAIVRDILLIDTDGAKAGQVNGLSVLSSGGYAFGRPSRITARIRLGGGGIVDIERETELGGPIHSKGVLILSSLLAARYAPGWPVALSASLVFEQSYAGVEGDSASAAEFCALLSAISEVPLRQDLAITGSINQFGQMQAIGGVNEKIEGFFGICEARGLSGRQGVIIPKANVQHLMLDDSVVDACRDHRFTIYAVDQVDEAVALLAGRVAGDRDADGAFPPDSVNRLVEDRLVAMAERRRELGERDERPPAAAGARP